MAGKKEIAAALFSFIYDNYLTNTPTLVIKDALQKVKQLLITLDDEKPKETIEEPRNIIATPGDIRIVNHSATYETPIIEDNVVIKKQRAPRKDKGMKRKNANQCERT